MIDPDSIDAVLESAVAQGALPGVIAVVGDRDGTVYERAIGLLSVDGGRPCRLDTMLALASLTKAITSVAALQLIEQDRLGLDQPVASLLPDFGTLQVLDGFDGDTPRLRAPASQATIRQLLTHTSGLGYWFTSAELLRYHQLEQIPDPLTGRRAALEEVPLVADPGSAWTYGTSTDWLGQVIEALSGQDLAAYASAHIFAPLGMSETTFTPSDEQRARMMALHARAGDGSLGMSPVRLPSEPEFFSGGGGAYSTARDYLRFARALLRGGELDGERILRPEAVELLFTDHLNGLELPDVMPSAVAELTNDVPSLKGVRQGFGLGLHLLLEEIPGRRRAGTGDWAGLFNCFYWIDRATGIAAALLTQVLPFFDQRIVKTMLAFNGAVFAAVNDGVIA